MVNAKRVWLGECQDFQFSHEFFKSPSDLCVRSLLRRRTPNAYLPSDGITRTST